ncbi:tRNA pseudouridine(38-40) synthase TruA [Aureisphaera sp. CAU 1614]|uniref:tRNA pseudouridine synthase A n=1 Tax=Halomarinibacterium sedimenti TaxID=2857106 RepID=A0A9X1FMT5_9FLAO|nr:tRNA pseudouridine(38-40) synthase TruA [Halomarinibacterium sedimenti]MBW2936552.1 tRNA pseudouridine(38-40) synthase TruA [Halomarinibacterium sedimenti]
MRYFIDIAYNGTAYCGWQNQPNALAVQEVLEKALSTLLGTEIAVTGAGRTDAGVHAKQLLAHFDAEEMEDVQNLLHRLNSFLPKDISVQDIFRVKDDAHARFDAEAREYEYHITLKKDPFVEGLAYLVNNEPDVSKMNEAAQSLLKYQDFQCFSRSKTDVKTYYCTITKAHWERKENLLIFTISANRFLRNMVRAIVGTLLEIGYGKLTLEDFHKIIESKNRSNAGASAPAHGLYLTKVVYPKTIKM